MAPCSFSSRAAAATRTLPRTASHIPIHPVKPEKTAPTRKKMLRPIFSESVSAGSRNSTKKTTTAKMARVLNWRLRKAEAPSCTAAPMLFILGVPSSAASTSRTNSPATPRASAAITATAEMMAILVPESSTTPRAARFCTEFNSSFDALPGDETAPGDCALDPHVDLDLHPPHG